MCGGDAKLRFEIRESTLPGAGNACARAAHGRRGLLLLRRPRLSAQDTSADAEAARDSAYVLEHPSEPAFRAGFATPRSPCGVAQMATTLALHRRSSRRSLRRAAYRRRWRRCMNTRAARTPPPPSVRIRAQPGNSTAANVSTDAEIFSYSAPYWTRCKWNRARPTRSRASRSASRAASTSGGAACRGRRASSSSGRPPAAHRVHRRRWRRADAARVGGRDTSAAHRRARRRLCHKADAAAWLDSPLWRRVRAEGGGGFRHRLGALARLLWAGAPSAEVDTRNTSESSFARTRWASIADDVRGALVRALAASGSGGGGATPLLPPLALRSCRSAPRAAGCASRSSPWSVTASGTPRRAAASRRRGRARAHRSLARHRRLRRGEVATSLRGARMDGRRGGGCLRRVGHAGWLGCAASHLLLWRRLAAGGPLAIDGGGDGGGVGGGGGGGGGDGGDDDDDALTLVLEDDDVAAGVGRAPRGRARRARRRARRLPRRLPRVLLRRRRAGAAGRSSCAATRCATTRTSCRGAARRAWSRARVGAAHACRRRLAQLARDEDADAPPALAVNDNHAALAGVGVSFDAEPRGPPRWRPWRPWRPPLAPEGPHQPHMGIVLQRLDAGTTLQSAEVRAWGGQAVGTWG